MFFLEIGLDDVVIEGAVGSVLTVVLFLCSDVNVLLRVKQWDALVEGVDVFSILNIGK